MLGNDLPKSDNELRNRNDCEVSDNRIIKCWEDIFAVSNGIWVSYS